MMMCPNPATQVNPFEGGIRPHEHKCLNVATNQRPDLHVCHVCGFCWQEN